MERVLHTLMIVDLYGMAPSTTNVPTVTWALFHKRPTNIVNKKIVP